ncbi:MAG: hypothetical protein JZD40_03555, partial [Sulfolobus sp.]|nr:hypothetical protein [Sulfolobus sp.]
KIPDVIIFPYNTGPFYHVHIDIFTLKKFIGWVREVPFLIPGEDNEVKYDFQRVTVKLGGVEVGKREVKNNKEAVSAIVEYTRYLLAKLTKDKKYMTEDRKEPDNIGKLKIISLYIDYLEEEHPLIKFAKATGIANIMNSELLEEIMNCKIVTKYIVGLKYMYPYFGREITAFVYCCSDRCFLYVDSDSETREFHGNKMFVIDLNGREPTPQNVEYALKYDNAKLVKDIERYILETHRKMQS